MIAHYDDDVHPGDLFTYESALDGNQTFLIVIDTGDDITFLTPSDGVDWQPARIFIKDNITLKAVRVSRWK